MAFSGMGVGSGVGGLRMVLAYLFSWMSLYYEKGALTGTQGIGVESWYCPFSSKTLNTSRRPISPSIK